MVRLRSFAQAALLEFHEISHVRLFADLATGTQMAVGSDRGARSDRRVLRGCSRAGPDTWSPISELMITL